MSDYNSSIPSRTENNGDIVVRIADGTITSQLQTINADGSINITDNGSSLTVDGTVELGATTLAALESITVQNGAGAAAVNIQDGGNSITVDGTVELGATTLAALESITVQNPAGASAVNIQDGGNSITVDASDLDIRDLTAASDSVAAHLKDGSGTSITSTTTGAKQSLDVALKDAAGFALGTTASPMVVAMSPDPVGTEINDYSTAAAVAAAATSNHDYTVTGGTTLKLTQIEASASGKMKIEVAVETGVATNVFTSRFVQFNSTAETNMSIHLSAPISVAAGVRVRVTRTNRDNQAQDLYSTISGIEVV